MLSRSFWLTVLLIAVAVVIGLSSNTESHAQDAFSTLHMNPSQDTPSTDSPLSHLLAMVPESIALNGQRVEYVDFKAITLARPGAPQIADWDEFEGIRDAGDDDPRMALWVSAFAGINSGPRDLVQYWPQYENLETVVGFDFFAIEQAITYGEPPTDVMLLAGDFDSENIISAFTQRDYVVDQSDPVVLLCHSAGCDTGLEMNLQERDPVNPFGGKFGRNQPVIATNDYVISSADIAPLQAIMATIKGEAGSIADVSIYHDAVEAIGAQGTIVQTIFLETDPLVFNPLTTLMGRASPEELERMREQFGLDRPLAEQMQELVPVFQLAVFAQTFDEEQQTAFVALVYDSENEAVTAGERVVERLTNIKSLVNQRSFQELVNERDATIGTPTVYETQDHFVALIPLHAPFPSMEPDPESGRRYTPSGLAYRLLVTMYYQRDMFWLATIESIAGQ